MNAANENKPHIWRALDGKWVCFVMVDGAYHASYGDTPGGSFEARSISEVALKDRRRRQALDQLEKRHWDELMGRVDYKERYETLLRRMGASSFDEALSMTAKRPFTPR
jgi:type II secretory pathway component PulJ